MRINYITTILFYFCLFQNVWSQPLSFNPNNSISNISIKQWTAEDGLASNNITSVFQDSKGLIWITSYNGFMIYDGERFEVYDKNDLSFLDTDGFICTLESPTGEIYLASQGSGIIVYDKGVFEKLSYKGDEISKSIRSLCFISDGTLMVGTNNNGLYRIQNGMSTKISSHPQLKAATIMAITEDNNSRIWVATEGSGLFEINGNEVKWVSSENDKLGGIITHLMMDNNNNLLIGSENGLHTISSSGEIETIQKLNSTYINSLMVDGWNSVWIGTEKGIARWNGTTNVLEWIYEMKGVDFVRISDILVDQQNNIWITSNRSGLTLLKESQVTNLMFPSLSSNRVYIVHESWDGNYYIGTDQNRIDIYDGKNISTFQLSTDLKGNGVRDIYHDEDGSLWFATYVGIIHFNKGNETLYSTKTGMPANNFRTILKDKKGFFWFGSRSGGLIKFRDGKIVKQFSNGQGLESNFVVAASEAPNGNIYVGTHSGGMTIIDSLDQSRTYYLKDKKTGVLFFNIDINPDLTAKVAANIGPVYFNGNSLTEINLESDLRSKTYFDIIDNRNGSIWMTTNIGILKIDSENWNKYLNNEIETVPYLLLDDNQGMNNKECTGATRSLLNKDGHLMIPTLGGVCIVNPASITSTHSEPKTVIRHALVDKNEIDIYQDLPSIPAGGIRYSFYYSVLSYSASERNQYIYFLEGFDKEWNPTTYSGQVEYTNLPPGKYTFKVKGSNDYGIWSNDEDSFSFEVEPFFYETIWFYILILIILASILFGMYKWRISFINRKNVELKKVNAELDRFVYSASHELRSPLSSILGLINVAKTDQNIDKSEYFDYIEKSVKRLDLFIHDIIDYSRNSRQDLQINEINLSEMIEDVINDISFMEHFSRIQYEINDELSSPFFNDKKRLKIVLSNIITNAFKHHDPEKVTDPYVKITLTKKGTKVIIEILDNGPGIEKKYQKNVFKMFYRATTRTEGTGLGLYIVSEIIETMGGNIKMNSELGNGTLFTLVLPSF